MVIKSPRNHICMKKIGMGQVKLANNNVVGATFLWCERLKVLGHKTIERDQYSAEILGFGVSRQSVWHKPQHYLFQSVDSAAQVIYEHRTSNIHDIGSSIVPHEIFSIGSHVDVSGETKGRGFSGVMKRWNFCGLGASHGVSKAHRKAGSTGQRTYPGRVFRGKKMAGRYGGERVTIQSLKVVLSESYEFNGVSGSLIGVLGAVPGPNNSLCFIKSAVKKVVQND